MKKLNNFFEENNFNVSLFKEENIKCAELETWTNGGVNMIIYLKPFTIKEFEEYVNDFDVDEEIELHRESQKYKNDFTIRESLTDFEEFHNRLKDVLSKLH